MNNTKIIQIWYNIKIPDQKVICISFSAKVCRKTFFKPFYFRQYDPFIYQYTSSFRISIKYLFSTQLSYLSFPLQLRFVQLGRLFRQSVQSKEEKNPTLILCVELLVKRPPAEATTKPDRNLHIAPHHLLYSMYNECSTGN